MRAWGFESPLPHRERGSRVFFEGFELRRVALGDVRIRVRSGGVGHPVVLVHGHPRTHTTWHRVAPLLADRHLVVAPDLRGYGESTLPPDRPDHGQSSKRAMAGDIVRLMAHLGHDRFAIAGHDRGALVAFRTAMDHPGAVTHLVVMDGLPVVEHLERTDATFARAWWHWWFFGQTDKPAERVINADPEAWYRIPGPEAIGADLAAVGRRVVPPSGDSQRPPPGRAGARRGGRGDRRAPHTSIVSPTVTTSPTSISSARRTLSFSGTT